MLVLLLYDMCYIVSASIIIQQESKVTYVTIFTKASEKSPHYLGNCIYYHHNHDDCPLYAGIVLIVKNAQLWAFFIQIHAASFSKTRRVEYLPLLNHAYAPFHVFAFQVLSFFGLYLLLQQPYYQT